MVKIGYAHVSSKDQNIDRQFVALEGVSKVFSDKLSGVTRNVRSCRLNYLREEDIVVVTELDRLSRKNTDSTKGATLDVLNLPSMSEIKDGNLRRLINHLIIELYKYQAESNRAVLRNSNNKGLRLRRSKRSIKEESSYLRKTMNGYNWRWKNIKLAQQIKKLNVLQESTKKTFDATI